MAPVIGIDIGTTSTKAVAYDVTGRVLARHAVGYRMDEPRPGWAEQDPDAILAAVIETVRIVAGQVHEVTGQVHEIAGISFSTAMHSLIGLDGAGRPLTPVLTWADSRAGDQAERLRASPIGLALHRRTGTPVHPMSPLVKLIWFREELPEQFARVRHWLGIKDYVVLRLTGTLVTDHSVASGTGLMDIHTLAWDPEALALAGIVATHLPALAPTTTRLNGLWPEMATATGLPAGVPVVLGAGDGPLANLGLGAIRPGVAAISIGTSAAVRVMVERPGVDPRGGVFCYALTQTRWAVGGAVNNGGIVLRWAADALAPELGAAAQDALLALAERAPPGSAGLIMLPYLLGERAPHWEATARGAYIGLSIEHRREHLVRAALEGVCLQLGVVLDAVRSAGNEISEVRATGGFARSPFWRQLLADGLDQEIGFPADAEGSSFGAALLGMQALGMIGSLDLAADLVRISEVVRPDPARADVYRELRPIFAGLYDALAAASTALRKPSER